MKFVGVSLLALSLSAAAVAATIPPPPATPTDNTVDTIQGVKVADPYRWLEDWNDPKVQAWSDARNTRTRAYLDAMSNRDAIKERLTTLIKATSPSYAQLTARGPHVF